MSELVERTADGGRKDLLKHLILQLHTGAAPVQVQRQLARMLGQVPYGLVVEVEQELIEDGMPPEDVTRLCHLHSAALQGAIDLSGAGVAPPGHPVHTFKLENEALARELDALAPVVEALAAAGGAPSDKELVAARVRLNGLADVEKHYLRKEHLLFPYLEKHGITGPPKVMWGKHDETRALLRAALGALATRREPAAALRRAAEEIRGMIEREENILLPMSLDTLEEAEWWEIARQSAEIGFCLVEPEAEWRPASIPPDETAAAQGRIRLPAGSLSQVELEAILAALPVDTTFVDAEDRVRWFSHGSDRVFSRSRAVIGRKVQFCHPPTSVDTVDQILSALRSGERDVATFWFQMRGRFVHVDYRALRGSAGEYLGCLEVTQDLTERRALAGERRLLSWDGPTGAPARAAAPGAPAHGYGAAPDGAEAGAAPAAGKAPPPASPAGSAHAGGPASAAVTGATGATGAPASCAPEAPGTPAPQGERPAWAFADVATRRLDARPLLAAGLHPVERILSELGGLAAGEVFELTTPFPPAPLVEKAAGVGCASHIVSEGPALVRTYFRRTR